MRLASPSPWNVSFPVGCSAFPPCPVLRFLLLTLTLHACLVLTVTSVSAGRPFRRAKPISPQVAPPAPPPLPLSDRVPLPHSLSITALVLCPPGHPHPATPPHLPPLDHGPVLILKPFPPWPPSQGGVGVGAQDTGDTPPAGAAPPTWESVELTGIAGCLGLRRGPEGTCSSAGLRPGLHVCLGP